MYPPAPHDPAALAYQQWLQQQQQPAPQYIAPAFPFALPPAAPHPLVPPQYTPPPPAPLASPYPSPHPAFQPSPQLPASPRRPRQLRLQHSQPEGNELVSLSIVLLSLLIGAAFGAVGEHHRLSAAVQVGVGP